MLQSLIVGGEEIQFLLLLFMQATDVTTEVGEEEQYVEADEAIPTSPTPVDPPTEAKLASLDTSTAQLHVSPREVVDQLDISDSDADSDDEDSDSQEDEDVCDSESEGVASGCGHEREPEDLRTLNKSHRPFRDEQPSELEKSADKGEYTCATNTLLCLSYCLVLGRKKSLVRGFLC